MTKTLLPTVTLDQCQEHTGLAQNHPAHTLYTTTYDTSALIHSTRYIPIGQCPGKHEGVTTPAVSADPFALISDAYEDDRDM